MRRRGLGLSRFAFVAALCTLATVGCAAEKTVPLLGSSLASGASGSAHSATSGYLFVASADAYPLGRNTQISVYAPDQSTASAVFAAGPGASSNVTRAIAFDAVGNLYVADDWNSLITVFPPGKTWPAHFIGWGIDRPSAMAFDRQGNLYVLNCPGFRPYYPLAGSVTVFKRGATKPWYTIQKGIGTYPWAMAIDASGNLYVANCPSCELSRGLGAAVAGNVVVYRPHATKPSRVITEGIQGPSALHIDAANNLYVANVGANGLHGTYSSVAFYPAGTNVATLTITQGLAYPVALAIDGKGDLDVANFGNGYKSISVTEYAAGQTTPVTTIPMGIAPIALTVDATGNLYVLARNVHTCCGEVTAYAPQSTTPFVSITSEIYETTAFGISP